MDTDLLSNTGLVSYYNDEPVAAAWLYIANAKLGQIGWPVTNPRVATRVRIAGLMMVFDSLVEIAEERGVAALQAFVDNSALEKLLGSMGFVTNEPHIYMSRVIQ